MQAVSFVCRCYAHASNPSSKSLMRMANVISHLEKNFAEAVDLNDLQEIANLSTSSLLKNFKEATGLSPIEYLLRVRISRAIELMADDDTTITDAAFAVGFSDSNYFARQFKRIMMVSPSDYRDRMRRHF
jgi:AraC family L-rhamnose operon transcriptional activator RhaR/AraC family L-rhamnose operon regulatory protein RhaS